MLLFQIISTILYIIFLGIAIEKCILKDNINIIILNQADKQTMLVYKCKLQATLENNLVVFQKDINKTNIRPKISLIVR